MKNLQEMNSVEIKKIAKELKIKNWWLLKKADLIEQIQMENEATEDEATEAPGIVEAIEEEDTKEEEAGDEELVTLKEIIGELGIKGTKARRILRGKEIERPYKRWEWHKDNHKQIIQQVIKYLTQTEKAPK